ncbi:MAG: carboxymethylenebutenolidase [Candidatus Rokuibacteriota bacterium]|nr:MAG: carboxymethylenebutenolidase [Candidatus Rokubacteria bacterium]
MTNPLSRREVLKFGAFTTVGGVLTPGISLAQAITTDTKGITARDVQLNAGGTMIPGYDARPEAQGRYPIIVVISGFTGNSEQNKDVVRRFAHAGFYAIAPELYSREGGMQGKDFAELGKIAAQVTRAQYLGDVKAAADYAKQQPWARADRLGVTGFCGGGALTLHFTAEYPGVAAAVPWYGHVKRVYKDAPGVDAFSLVAKIKAPVLGLYGEADTGIPAADVKQFEIELKKTNPDVEFVLYSGAPHAFFSDDRPQVYKKEAAEDGWKRCVAFFTKHLKA